MSDAIQSATAERTDVRTDDGPTTGGRVITISDSAVRRVRQMIERRADDTLILRVSVSGGGCSGFQYGIGFDNAVHEDDLVFERDGVRLAVDDVSLDLLDGSEVDFVEELIGASFQVRNPNAASSCGCGTSFSI
ncbi:iron-sulfur cluster insertion protein ErpA [Fodinicurvata sp. EGI_FJ10296]|uniref:iron-sulfur cluster insertion protein ErpA n=1 Tax=Fodinicurvata sp. EGI_FJ10296 TaxID=3231908 RepID=UPI003455C8F2